MEDDDYMLELATQIVAAHVSSNTVAAADLPDLIRATHAALAALGTPPPAAPAEPEHAPAVAARRSLASPDHILSMIDGKPYRTLRKHLRTHGLTPDEYRKRYKLPADYPMTARAYSEQRSAMAVARGFGRKAAAAALPALEPQPAPAKRRGRPPKVAADESAAAEKPRGKRLSGAEALAQVRGETA